MFAAQENGRGAAAIHIAQNVPFQMEENLILQCSEYYNAIDINCEHCRQSISRCIRSWWLNKICYILNVNIATRKLSANHSQTDEFT